MKNPRGASDNLEPLFDAESGEWHEIASLPATDLQKVSSLIVKCADLDDWYNNWMDTHGEHADEDRSNSVFVTYGDLDDDVRPWREDPIQLEDGTWEWEDDSDTEFMIECCGQERPLKKGGQALVVTPAPGNDFVTVRDYVGATHAWLMERRDDIIKSKQVGFLAVDCAGEETLDWMVDGDTWFHHRVEEKQSWVKDLSPRPPPTEAELARNAAFLQSIQTMKRL